MDIDVGITLENNRDEEVKIRIPAGSIFETTKTTYGIQNVVVIKDYIFKVPARGKRKVMVRSRCLNQRRSIPNRSRGRATPFRYTGANFNQSAIWNSMASPISRRK